jgi:hypothetical protein
MMQRLILWGGLGVAVTRENIRQCGTLKHLRHLF